MTFPSLDGKSGRKTKDVVAPLIILIILGSVASMPLAATPIQQASAQATQFTSIDMDPQSAITDEQVIIRGFLSSPPNYPNVNLIGQQINITLSDLEDILPDVVLDPVFAENDFGDFFANFTAPSDSAYWLVTADFAGDAEFLPSTGLGIFATTEPGALTVQLGDGQDFYPNVNVTLTDFTLNATLNFDEVPEDYLLAAINATVSQCTSPDPQGLFLPLSFDTVDNNDNICLEVFPGPILQLDNEPIIQVNMSYAGIEALPAGYSENNIDLFYYDPFTGELIEITESRDVEAQRITGTSFYTGRFIVGIGLHGEAPDGAIRQHVFAGDGQQVMFRDIADQSNATASIVSISPDEVTLEEPVTITLNYSNGNLDVEAIDTLPVEINSTSSTPDFVTIEFTETSIDSGIFTGNLTLTSGATSGSLLHASDTDTLTFVIADRDTTDARFEAILDGLCVAGVVELSDYEITETELDELVNSTGIVPVVGLVNMTLVDVCMGFDGQVNVTMSYANSLLGPVGDPSVLKIFHKEPGSQWDTDNPPVPTLDTANLVVSATFDTSTPGLFALAFPPGGFGGAGGGLGRPGVGVVLDFLAPFASSSSSDDEEGGASGGSNGGGSGRRVVIVNQQTDTFPKSYFGEHPLEKIKIGSTSFLNADGTSISNGNVGQQISIASTFTNHQQEAQSYSFIVLILDEDGFAIDIAWQEGTVESGESVDLSSSWIPEDGGNYTIKMFVWDGISISPTPLSIVMVKNLNVTE